MNQRMDEFMAGHKVVAGSGAGGLAETQEMLDYCAEHNLVSGIELINIQDIHPAFDRMEKGDVRYRFVIDMASLRVGKEQGAAKKLFELAKKSVVIASVAKQ